MKKPPSWVSRLFGSPWPGQVRLADNGDGTGERYMSVSWLAQYNYNASLQPVQTQWVEGMPKPLIPIKYVVRSKASGKVLRSGRFVVKEKSA